MRFQFHFSILRAVSAHSTISKVTFSFENRVRYLHNLLLFVGNRLLFQMLCGQVSLLKIHEPRAMTFTMIQHDAQCTNVFSKISQSSYITLFVKKTSLKVKQTHQTNTRSNNQEHKRFIYQYILIFHLYYKLTCLTISLL